VPAPTFPRRAVLALGVLALAAAVAPDAPATGIRESLLELADRALSEGDLETAADRYRRVADAWPGTAAAWTGLGRVALARGDTEAARGHFEAAVAAAAAGAAGHAGLADLALHEGEAARARRLLAAALEASPGDAALHERLWRLTDRAPATPAEGREAVLARAEAHPYDPAARLAAGRLLAGAGEGEAAARHLRAALLVADLDPSVAHPAARALARLEGREDGRRYVPVHLWADQSVRDREGWRFELRIAMARASQALDGLLDTLFYPVLLEGFLSSGDALATIREDWAEQMDQPPRHGILAVFTRRSSPRTRLANRLGQAALLGREMLVRLDARDPDGRTLAHEILHLYGAIHVSDTIRSIMNPAGGDLVLDPYNQGIVSAARGRRFGAGAFEQEVLAHVDVAKLAAAYMQALAVNAQVRKAGLLEALEEAGGSRRAAAPALRRATAEDEHLADVARIVAYLLLSGDRPAQAVAMMDNAARLYGPRSAAGRDARATADRWRATYKAFLR